MLSDAISARIDRLSRAEWWSRSRPEFVVALLTQSGLVRADVEEALEFLDQYVRSVPEVLSALSEAAEEVGLTVQLHPLLEAVAGYWELTDDHIPDHLGLVGLADDAYLSFRLLERFVEEYRWASGGDLLPGDLSQVNRVMRRLLGPEISQRLEEEVEATFERSQLRSAARALSRWRGELPLAHSLPVPSSTLSAPVVPAAIRVPVKGDDEGEAVAEGAEDGSSRLSTPEVIRGNVSVLALGIGVGLFYLWQRYFQFPSSADVRLLGWEGIELGWLVGLRNLILGSLGLSTLIAAGNLKKLISEFYRPLKHLEGLELKRFYAAWGTMIFSLLSLGLFLAVCASNVTVRLGALPPDFELVAYVDGGGDAFLVTTPVGVDGSEPIVGDEARLGGPDSVRLALRGLRARAVLLLRDKYNLATVDALLIERRPWRVELSPLRLQVRPPAHATPSETQLLMPRLAAGVSTLHRATRWTLSVRSPFRYARGIPNLLHGQSGVTYGPRNDQHLFLAAPGDGTPCPGRAPLSAPEIQLFWDEICAQRLFLGRWTRESSFFDVPSLGTVAVDLRQHQVQVRYVRGEVVFDEERPPLETKEAVKLVGRHRVKPDTAVLVGEAAAGTEGELKRAAAGGS